MKSKPEESVENNLERQKAIRFLENFFEVEVPPDLHEIVIRRMFTLAAYIKHEVVANNEEIKLALSVVGAIVPQEGNERRCFGVLYREYCQTCQVCSLIDPCRKQAANVGLGTLRLSKSLLGPKNLKRTPLLGPTTPQIITENQRDEEILAFLNEHFASTLRKDALYYRHRERAKKRTIYLFCADGAVPLRLKFINPSEDLKPRLVQGNSPGPRAYYLPEDISADNALSLIRSHATEVYLRSAHHHE